MFLSIIKSFLIFIIGFGKAVVTYGETPVINLNLAIITAASVNNRILEKWSKEFAYIQCKLGANNICVIQATKLLILSAPRLTF